MGPFLVKFSGFFEGFRGRAFWSIEICCVGDFLRIRSVLGPDRCRNSPQSRYFQGAGLIYFGCFWVGRFLG